MLSIFVYIGYYDIFGIFSLYAGWYKSCMGEGTYPITLSPTFILIINNPIWKWLTGMPIDVFNCLSKSSYRFFSLLNFWK